MQEIAFKLKYLWLMLDAIYFEESLLSIKAIQQPDWARWKEHYLHNPLQKPSIYKVLFYDESEQLLTVQQHM